MTHTTGRRPACPAPTDDAPADAAPRDRSPAPAHRVATAGTVAVVLPADWHVVDLRSDAARHTGVVALVDRQVPRRDDLATVRRTVRRDVEDSSRRAAQAGGLFSAYMMTAIGPVALPAVLTAYRVPGSFAQQDDLDAFAATLALRVAGQPAEPGAAGEGTVGKGPVDEGTADEGTVREGTVDVGDGALGPVLRATTTRAARADDGAADLVRCDYWTDPADGDGLLLLSFSTPVVTLRDAFLDLFDAVAGSLHHDAGDPTPDRGDADTATAPLTPAPGRTPA